MSIPEQTIMARTALIAAFQQDASGCIEEWALYKCACDVLNGENIIEVCAHQPVTIQQVEQCIQLQRSRAVKELHDELVERVRKQNKEQSNES
jgi:hypothetical protein